MEEDFNIYDDTEISLKSLLFQLLLLAVCISLSIFNKQFIYVTFAVSVIACLLNKNQYVFCQLFFLLPFTVIFKLSPESSSSFAYLLLIVAISLIIRRKINILILLPIGIYTLLGLLNNPILWVKLMSSWVLLIYFIEYADTNWVKYTSLSCALGLIISSLWGLVKFDIPQLSVYINERNSEYMLGERIERFSGLYYDPNYYSVTIIMVLFMILYFGVSNQLNKKIVFPIAVVLLYFGALSYSKMYFLAAFLVIIVQFSNLIKYAQYKFFTFIIIVVTLWGIIPAFQESNIMANFSDRLTNDDISSGRFFLIESYLTYIFSNIDVLILGKGLGGGLYGTHGPHNTFVEFLYYLGLVGSIIYVLTLFKIFNSREELIYRTPMNYSLLLIFCIMIYTLGMLTMNDLMFYFMLLWYSMNIDYNITK